MTIGTSTARRGPGRPRKTEGRLDTTLPVRMTSAEKADLETVAESCGLSSADYLRRAAAYCRVLGVPLGRDAGASVGRPARET